VTKRSTALITASLIAAALFGCSSATPSGETPSGDQGSSMCPIELSGTTVTVVDVPGGVALSFSTVPRNVRELRDRVTRLAQYYNDPPTGLTPFGGAPLSDPSGATPMGVPQQGVQTARPPSSASVEETDSGARLVLTPRDDTRLPRMREQVREDALAMTKTGECP